MMMPLDSTGIDTDAHHWPQCRPLDETKLSLVVDAATDSLDVFQATDAWTARFGTVPGSLAEFSNSGTFARVKAELGELIAAAQAGRWNSDFRRTLRGVTVPRPGGGETEARLYVTLSHPTYWGGGGRRPARVTLVCPRHASKVAAHRSAGVKPLSTRLQPIPEGSMAESQPTGAKTRVTLLSL